MNLNKPYNGSCPKCSTQCAYISMMNVECLNENCEHFEQSHLQAVVDFESTMDSIYTVYDEKEDWGVAEQRNNAADDEELDEFSVFYDSWSKLLFP